MDTPREKPMSQEALKAEIDRILSILNGQKDEAYFKICERFIGENQFIQRYKTIFPSLRLKDFDMFLMSQADSPSMQYFQINYCVICKLTDEQFGELENGILEARARRDGFKDYNERSEIAQDLGGRMAAILALSDDDDFRKQKVSNRLYGRHTALFANLFYIGIDPNLPNEEMLPLALMEIDLKQINEIMRPSIEIAESELANLMEA